MNPAADGLPARPRGIGPLHGVRVIEMGGIGPGPFAAMLLADMGADVVRVDRPGRSSLLGGSGAEPILRGRARVTVDLKDPAGLEFVRRAAAVADAFIEGMRPGVSARLGLGPEDILAINPRIVYGQMTGYGQDGPLAQAPGHDINYISLAGVLGPIARRGERPMFPLNLVGDYGGGGMLLAFGVVCGILEARNSGRGQVVDAAMIDGSALLTTLFHGLRAEGKWNDEPGTNILDSGAHFYNVYETADGRFISVGAIEPQFYEELLALLEIDRAVMPQDDADRWPEFTDELARRFRTRTRDAWVELAGRYPNACVTPVLSLAEAPEHDHNVARQTFTCLDGVQQPAPAPRFSETPARILHRDARTTLLGWGLSEAQAAAAH